jgi:hypothetical protein
VDEWGIWLKEAELSWEQAIRPPTRMQVSATIQTFCATPV